ncbi:hypothetical protein FISHEDRAFT_75585 [Fistulina hepatica ATCC 64428]|uniref:Actin cytoskeleton-regulatory complex protein PAN1 n=1 Tax=Fistulina hepatica ATCC 64428 TaxID=1128425 RepID=A0A0D7A6Z0_9AGAR|nr:hypothetical protein FISHEDRAFT_75585 [Fistulina hepatica ATCC 64428]
MSQWQGGYQYPVQTGYPGQQQFQQQQPPQLQQAQPTFSSQPNLLSQPTGFAGAQPRLLSQQTGFPGMQQRAMGIQNTSVGVGLGTGFAGGMQGQGLQAQTGFPGGYRQAPPPPVPPIPSQFQSQANATLSAPSLQQPTHFLSPSPAMGGQGLGMQPGLTAQPTGFPAGGLLSQPTGFPTARPLVAQPTGFVDPRLQMISSTFMPVNTNAPYSASGLPQLPSQQLQGGLTLQQSFQQHNEQRGSAPRISWALSKTEKKSYDQIFRAWDTYNTGFISGPTALEVFGQSGLDKADLAKIWSLADGDDRGKLNISEFHVAMALIYRRLSGNPIPDTLPPELVPPSAKDLDSSVNFVKDILRHESRDGTPNPDGTPMSLMKDRSFHSNGGQDSTRDATIYRHNDTAEHVYQPRSRHVNRDAVRAKGDLDNKAMDLEDMKRQLESTAAMLDAHEEKTEEDDRLDREMDDLRYQVKRVTEDIEYATRRGNQDERRRLERESLQLLHEKIPALQRRIKDRDERREREKREWARERDRRNGRFGMSRGHNEGRRYEDDRGYDRPRSRAAGGDYDRPSSRAGADYDRPSSHEDYGSYNRDRPRSRAEYDRPRSSIGDRERNRDRDRDRDYNRDRDSGRDYDRDRDEDRDRDHPRDQDRPASAVPDRMRPTAPPMERKSSVPMTAEERRAFAQQEAQRRIQARMAALGVTSPSPATPSVEPTIDTSVEDRLVQEKKEAEEKARQAEKEAEVREVKRRERIQREGGKTPTNETPVVPAPVAQPVQLPSPPTLTQAPAPPPPQLAMAPAAPKRAPAPPPPRKGRAPPPPAPSPRGSRATAPAPPPAAPAVVVPDPEEEVLKAREAAILQTREARTAKLRQLEEEERREREEEERYNARLQSLRSKTVTMATPPPPAAEVASPPPPPPFQAASPPAPVPPPPPVPSAAVAPLAATPASEKSTNPFSKLINQGASSPSSASVRSTNPWATPTAAEAFTPPPAPAASLAPPTPPTAPAPPAAEAVPRAATVPPPVKASYHTAPSGDDSDWDEIVEKDGQSDSSDDEEFLTRDSRKNIAAALFGGSGGGGGGMMSRPASTPATVPAMSTPPPAAPPASLPPPLAAVIPPPPPASMGVLLPAPQTIGGPPPPPPPPADFATAAPPSSTPGDRGALLSSIQGGLKLRKAHTVDKSGPQVSGKVLGDEAPPAHINTSNPVPSPSPPQASTVSLPAVVAAPQFTVPPPPPLSMESQASGHSYRESVDWYADMAAGGPPPSSLPNLPPMQEEPEDVAPAAAPVPDIRIQDDDAVSSAVDAFADIDRTIEFRARTLYAYQAQGPDDLHFQDNMTLLVNPSKTGGDWWYGRLVSSGQAGLFPKAYVQEFTPFKAHAMYDYTATNPDELSLSEGREVSVVDTTEDQDWWKVEEGGSVFIVPAAYVELVEATDAAGLSKSPTMLKTSNKVGSSVVRTSVVDIAASTHQEASTTCEQQREGASVQRVQSLKPELRANENGADDDGDDSDSSSSSEYLSFDDIDDEQNDSNAKALERAARERERCMVLEAAGLVVQQDATRRPPPRPSRRLAPVLPVGKTSSSLELPLTKELPMLPPDEPLAENVDPAQHLDDAFQRYESFKKESRVSIVSTASSDALTMSPTGSLQATHSPTPSLQREEGKSHSSFLHFLNKIKSSDTPEKRLLTISAPVLQSESSSRSGSETPAFGSSWASLVDFSALEGIPADERKRQEVIFELIATEGAYVRDLQLIVEVFYSSMLPLLDRKAVAVVFANIEDILLANTVFLSSIEERQKDCRLYIDRIGDILEDHMRKMDIYLEYCANQSNAIKVLQSLRSSNPELASHLQRIQDEDPSVRSLDLSSYLLEPMQRLTRYPLLIKKILRYTEEGTGEWTTIHRALATSEKILNCINETIRTQESHKRLQALSENLWIGQGRLDLTAPTQFMGARKILKEGPLTKAKSGRKLLGILCNDVLVLTDQSGKSLYRLPIRLSETEVKDSWSRDVMTFQLATSSYQHHDVIAFRAISERECQLWVQAVETAIRKCRTAQRRAQRKVHSAT